ncbi:phosphatases II [Phlebopus sp. FC_14]|nr:phosphatases II [Phlebopus sp. FC_14]
MKQLSINLASAQSSTNSLLDPLSVSHSLLDPSKLDMPHPSRPRRPSVLSLPNTAITTALHRKDEDGSPTLPYIDGPVQVLPGIWLGSEDNARDWPVLIERGIKSILNVAKEVTSPFDSSAAQPLRPFASTPNLGATSRQSQSTYYPPHIPSGRPGMHYLKLQWSHGQRDLVTNGFPTAMTFVDAALERNEGVLIHCQCGISRSATLMIAIVMRAAATRSPWVPPDVWDLKGMQAAYSFVKEKSKHAGPNMSLIYQLLDYEKALQGETPSPASSDKSFSSEEEKEWGRRRNAFGTEDDEARDNDAVQQEAKDLDRAMEERVIARKPSASSLASGVGMGPAWKNRYGRKRTGSTASVHTTGSVLSEDLVEADEEAELLGLGGFDDITEPRRSPSLSSESPGSPSESSTQSTLSNPPAARPPPVRRHLNSAPSAPSTKLSFSMPRLSSTNTALKIIPGKPKRRPPPLGILPPVPPSPMTPVPVQDGPTSSCRRKHLSRKQAPSTLRVQEETSRIVFPSKVTSARLPMTATPSQTLFVFPPSPTVAAATLRTPSTMTVTSSVHNDVCPFPSQSTPRVATSRSQGRTKSFIGVGASVAPTTAYSRVDARGWVGLE